jgi:multicomponent Na+:H+ antiporter subunit D
VKAALFVCVGIVQHRRASIDEVDLHGRGRDLRALAVAFFAAAIVVAGLPPFGPFLGKALVEDAASKVPGMEWVPAAMMVASALAAGALLRAGARVFLGLGPPGVADESSDEARSEAEPEEDEPRDRTPAIMWLPALGLLGAGLAWGVIPGLTHAVVEAAASFVDSHGYATAVLRGGVRAPAHVPPTTGPSGSSYLYGAGAALLAVAVAAVGVARPRAVDRVRPALTRLRVLHSGHVGDYAAWLTAGVAVIGTVLGVTLR